MHVELIVAVGSHLKWHVFNHFKTIALKSHTLYRVIGHQAHLGYSQYAQDVSAHAVVTFIGFKAQVDVGINGVIAVLLQLIGFDFVHQADASTFLIHIHEDAFAFFLYHLHGKVQLFAALATHRAEDVASGT